MSFRESISQIARMLPCSSKLSQKKIPHNKRHGFEYDEFDRVCYMSPVKNIAQKKVDHHLFQALGYDVSKTLQKGIFTANPVGICWNKNRVNIEFKCTHNNIEGRFVFPQK